MLIFTYGTLKTGLPSHHFMNKYRLVSRARTVERYPLITASFFNNPYILNKPGLGYNIKGEIYDVGDDIEVLDRVEHVPDLYDRKTVKVEQENGSEVDVEVYVLSNFKPELLQKKFLAEYTVKEAKTLDITSDWFSSVKQIIQEVKNPVSNLLFSYGTLRKSRVNHHALSGHRLIGTATTVEKYPFVVTTSFNVPFVLNKKGTGLRVVGELYSVSEDWNVLDRFEQVPLLYSREAVQVKLENGEILEAQIYMLNDFREELLNEKFISDYVTEESRELIFPNADNREQYFEDIAVAVKNR